MVCSFMKAYCALCKRSRIIDLASVADASRVTPRYLKEATVGMGVSACVIEPEQLINIAAVLSTLR